MRHVPAIRWTVIAPAAFVLALAVGGAAMLLVVGCPGNDPIVDGDADSDADADADTDADADHDADDDTIWYDGDAPPGHCATDDECVLALNFNVCCPCAEAMARSSLETGTCILQASGSPTRPEGCGLGCEGVLCEACPAEPSGVDCYRGDCTTLYPGDCTPGVEGTCPEGERCELDGTGARCVDDPSDCATSEDCERSGWECRDWRTDGVLTCWHPDSDCMDDLQCVLPRHFCEDPEEDGVYACIDGSPDCRPGAMEGPQPDCPEGQSCDDPDDDGRGSCVPS